MRLMQREKVRIYAILVKILGAYGISRRDIHMQKDLVKDYAFHKFELAALMSEIEERMRVELDLAIGNDTRIESIVDRLHALQQS